ncbi:substrate-binding domain-containing protein [Nocardioides sp.]|uniref:substrate-binding domain-containing protein n=1 Tax=Nocardioides sp. TaxID=35761 RepID=UPI0039E437BD
MKSTPVRIVIAVVVAALVLLGAKSTSSGDVLGANPACREGKGKIGFVPKLGTDPYMTTVFAAAEKAAKANGTEVIYTAPSEANGAAQIPFVYQLMAQDVCVIAISGSDVISTKKIMQLAAEKGIKVISWDSDIDPDARSIFVNQAATPALGDQMLNALVDMLGPEGGEFAILSSTPTAVNQNAWIAAIRDRLASDPALANFKLVKVAYGLEKADENARQATGLVQSYKNLKGIIVPAGIGLPAAAQALEQTGDLGKVKLSGLAPASLIKPYIEAGQVQDVWWSVPDLGTLTYYTAQALARGDITGAEGETYEAGELGTFTIGENGVVLLGEPKIVTPENVDEFPF